MAFYVRGERLCVPVGELPIITIINTQLGLTLNSIDQCILCFCFLFLTSTVIASKSVVRYILRNI